MERSETIANAEREIVGDIRGAAGVTTDVDRFERVELRLIVAEFAFGTDEGNVVRTVPRVVHLDAVLKDGADVLAAFVSDRLEFDGFFGVESENVHSAAEFVSAPVGEESVSVFRVTSPSAAVVSGASLAIEGRRRRLTLPTIPVEAFRNRLLRQIAVSRRVAESNEDLFDVADRAALDDRRHVSVVFHNALATARADAIVLARRFDDESGLLQSERERFLAVDVFTCLACFDRDLRVPVIRASAYDRVDVVALEDVFVMRVFRGGFVLVVVVDAICGSIKVILVAVANAENLIVGVV